MNFDILYHQPLNLTLFAVAFITLLVGIFTSWDKKSNIIAGISFVTMLVMAFVPMTLKSEGKGFGMIDKTGITILVGYTVIVAVFLYHLFNRPGKPDVVKTEHARDAAQAAFTDADSARNEAKRAMGVAVQAQKDTEVAVQGIANLMANLTSPNKTLAALVELYVVEGSQAAPFDTARAPDSITCDPASNGLTDPENGLLLVAYREAYKVDNSLTPSSTIQDILDTLNP